MIVTVYGAPGCSKCKITQTMLTQRKIDFTVKDITSDEAARARVEALGFKLLPVVEAEHLVWNDLRLDKIRELSQLVHAA